jgi:N-acetylmuramoyl-L-alanine amidase
MKKESSAIRRLCNIKSKVSSHYFIKNSGKIFNLVPERYTAWHAGISSWKNITSLNNCSIGIEINNPGHHHGYKNFSNKQIISLLNLLRYLMRKYKIKKDNVLGHSDIAPSRKKDPGEKFPWKKLAKENLSFWHNLNERKIVKFRKEKVSLIDENYFFKNLHKIGYCNIKKIDLKKNRKYLVEAFQRRFRQGLVNGKLDKECVLIAKNLIK